MSRIAAHRQAKGPSPESPRRSGTCNISLDRTVNDALTGVRGLMNSAMPAAQLSVARSLTVAAIKTYWCTQIDDADAWPLPLLTDGVALTSIPAWATTLAGEVGSAMGALDPLEASYRIGLFYTAMMPDSVRSDLGAYYTPPALCERLLDMATECGVDWRTARVLDPACGGGAFLAPVARRMLASLSDCSPRIALKNIAHRLRGFEVDPFAAWMSSVFLELCVLPLCRAVGVRLANLIEVGDSLIKDADDKGYDLVIGNPPYGRVSLSPDLREKYRRSLYGHANLYGLFTDLAIRFTRKGGVIAYVTPTSFLSGEYFKALRALLATNAPPVAMDFVTDRKGVFPDVLQETVLTTFRSGSKRQNASIHFVSSQSGQDVRAEPAGSFPLPDRPEMPWLVQRHGDDRRLLDAARKMPHRLSDYGYKVSTGPLVWNRHKGSLRENDGRGRYPLLWAEAVRPGGTFEFRALKKNHMPYFEPDDDERWVLTDVSCVLLQRTTAKEQARRLIAAELPQAFIDEHGAVVVENHLNMIKPSAKQVCISTACVAALFNSDTVDRLFRCMSGSVAVSAYELSALPLPAPEALERLEVLVAGKADRSAIEREIAALYGEQ